MQEFTDRDNCAEDEEIGEKVAEMSLIQHLEDLRRRLIIAILAVAAGSCLSYFYAAEIVKYITASAGTLYYMNPAEGFFVYLKVSFFAGFLLALPVVLYQVWLFILPALTVRERTALIVLVPASVILFFTGMAFSYFFVLPAGIKFFLGFSSDTLRPLFSVSEYISFIISFLLPFGCIFELPLLIVVLAKIGLINSAFLASKRKVILVLSFVIGAVIAPTPDIFSQTMVAVPLLILYEASIVIVKCVLRK